MSRSLDNIIQDIINGKDYCEISFNYVEGNGNFTVTGYCGYDAQRLSKIENSDIGKELINKLTELGGNK